MVATFLDLFTAKVALEAGDIGPEVAREGLQSADQGGGDMLRFLGPRLAPEVVQRIEQCARRCLYLKGEDAYWRVLSSRRAVSEEQARPHAVRARQEQRRLGPALVAAGLLSPDLDRELLQLSKQALEQEGQRITSQMRQQGYQGIAARSKMVAQVVAAAAQLTASGRARAPAPAVTPSPTGIPVPARPGNAAPPPLGQGEGTEILPGDVASGQTPLRPERRQQVAAAPPPAGGGEEVTIEMEAPPIPLPGAAAAPALPPELAGTGLDETYAVLRKLGEGGMGAVYLAYTKEDVDRSQPVALKVVRPAVVGSEKSQEAAARFKREILATSFCAHENIIEIYDASETRDGSYYMAMEFVDGEQLDEVLKREGALPVARVVSLLEEVLQGLEAIHQANIVHRDIKPQNFRIWRDEAGRERLKVMDFGIARVLDAEHSGAGEQFFQTIGGRITGSPAYLSPESITEPDKIDERSDLYSLGITIFRIATNRLPFVAREPTEFLPHHLYSKPPSLREAVPDAPAELEELYYKLLEKVPGERFQTAADALAFLRERVEPVVLGDDGRAAPPALDNSLDAQEGQNPFAEIRQRHRAAQIQAQLVAVGGGAEGEAAPAANAAPNGGGTPGGGEPAGPGDAGAGAASPGDDAAGADAASPLPKAPKRHRLTSSAAHRTTGGGRGKGLLVAVVVVVLLGAAGAGLAVWQGLIPLPL